MVLLPDIRARLFARGAASHRAIGPKQRLAEDSGEEHQLLLRLDTHAVHRRRGP
jgi:hypothetical protein